MTLPDTQRLFVYLVVERQWYPRCLDPYVPFPDSTSNIEKQEILRVPSGAHTVGSSV